MIFLGSLQVLIYWALALAALGMQIFCLVDALRHRADAFPPAATRRSRSG